MLPVHLDPFRTEHEVFRNGAIASIFLTPNSLGLLFVPSVVPSSAIHAVFQNRETSKKQPSIVYPKGDGWNRDLVEQEQQQEVGEAIADGQNCFKFDHNELNNRGLGPWLDRGRDRLPELTFPKRTQLQGSPSQFPHSG